MQYNYFWICDAGIRVLPQTLKELVSKMTDKVALVHAIPYASKRFVFIAYIVRCTVPYLLIIA